ncbi:homeobox-leucine zipper protein ROC8-like isoform X2 [Primulina huaijiensis]|uniref:homeobox-leucine zipper protein ROC8-like isoform X2 n=1 Tax=Primulina huaijiensis TaxID=1492673 RepID=UPI003CC70C0C
MHSAEGGSGSGDKETSNSQKGKIQYRRHSEQKIQRLEAFFKECPHPDENQRQQLSRELSLDPMQIKFWFQNKRTQTKAQNDRAENNALRSENERFRSENLAMQEVLRKGLCQSCIDSTLGEEEKHSVLQRLKIENVLLTEEHRRLIDKQKLAIPPPGIGSFLETPGNLSVGDEMGVTAALDREQTPWKLQDPTSQLHLSEIEKVEKSLIIGIAASAMDELVELLHLKEPVWIKSATDGRSLIHHDSYYKLFPKANHLKTASARIESSKDSGMVAVAATHLIEMLLDSNKWKDLFPTIINEAGTIEVIDTGEFGGSLNLMYGKIHVLSPLVAPREFNFIRYCRQLNSRTWILVDVSYDFIKQFEDAAPTNPRKFPSGCMIEDISNGKSNITWIEHVEVDDKSLTHRLYRDLLCNCQAYGATRWVVTLQRMCERIAFSVGRTMTHKHALEGVIGLPEGRRNLMNLCHRMVKNFCEELSFSDRLDFSHSSASNNSGVRVSLHRSTVQGMPNGLILSAATSLWLPLSYETLFDFFKDEKNRAQWDALSNGNISNEIAHISTGTHPGNCVSIIQPYVPEESNMLILQESCIDPLGAMVIYAPIELPSVIAAVNGENMAKIPILPSGFVISTDGCTDDGVGASSSSSKSRSRGSLLTVAFQILMCYGTRPRELNMETISNVHALLSTTIQKIKTALDCSDVE